MIYEPQPLGRGRDAPRCSASRAASGSPGRAFAESSAASQRAVGAACARARAAHVSRGGGCPTSGTAPIRSTSSAPSRSWRTYVLRPGFSTRTYGLPTSCSSAAQRSVTSGWRGLDARRACARTACGRGSASSGRSRPAAAARAAGSAAGPSRRAGAARAATPGPTSSLSSSATQRSRATSRMRWARRFIAATVSRLDGELELRGEACGAQHAQRVLPEALARVADRADDAGVEVGSGRRTGR